MIRVKSADLEKLRQEIDQIATTAFWLETYAMGLAERAKRMKKYLLDLEMVATVPTSAVREEQASSEK